MSQFDTEGIREVRSETVLKNLEAVMIRKLSRNAAYCLAPYGLFSLCSYTMQDHLLRWSSHINNESRKYVTASPTALFYGGIFLIVVPSSQMFLAYVKLTTINIWYCPYT